MRIRNYEDLINHGNVKGRKMMADIMEAGLSAGNPYSNTLSLVSIRDNKLIFDNRAMEPSGDPRSGPAVYDLDVIERIFIFAVGKGILFIVKALEDVIGERLTGGLAMGKHGDDLVSNSRVEVTFGGHPVPDEHSVAGCRRIMDMAASLNLTENDLVITIMGNGCSALAALPAEGISVEDLAFLNQMGLIDTGMTTEAMSYLRNQIDCFRGGRVVRAMRPAQIVNLVGINPASHEITEKYENPYENFLRTNLWLPNLPDCTTTPEAIEVAKKWGIYDRLPKSILDKLLSNPKESDTLSFDEFESFDCRVFGVMPAGMSVIAAAQAKAEEYGFKTLMLTANTHCEAAPTGHYVAQLAKYSEKMKTPFAPPCALFQSGELIVTVGGQTGVGGTNQEFCAAASLVIDGNKRIIIAGIDTDGTDGPGGDFHPDAVARGIRCLTGGIVDGYTAGCAREKGIDLFRAVKTHGTSAPLWELGSGIAARQGISVGDMQCVLIMDEDG